MGNFLAELFGIPSAQAAPAAPAARTGPTFTAAQDRAAQAAGFPSAEAAYYFQRQKELRRTQQTVAGATARPQAGGVPAAPAPQSGNFLANVLSRVSAALGGH